MLTTTTLYGIAIRHGLPDYVKTADMNELVADALHPQAYADLSGRKYPIHTKAACVFSAAQISELPESEKRRMYVDRVKKAADGFGVLTDVESVLHPVSTVEDPAMFAWKDSSGNALPIKTAVDMQKTADWILENRPKMGLPRCQHLAKAVIKRAEETGVVLKNRGELYRLAGHAIPDVPGLKAACEWRSRALSHMPAVSAQLKQLATQVASQPMDIKIANTVIMTLDELDGAYNLRGQYAHGMPRPEAGYGGTVEELELLKESMVVTSAGDVFDKSAFTRITTSHVAGWMGEGFLEKTSEHGSLCPDRLSDAVESLNRAEANRFAKMADAVGIKPIGRVTPSQPLVA